MGEMRQGEGERDTRLASIYRAAPADEPPSALDDAIRAAARRTVGARPRPAGASLLRWQLPLSVAAVLVLCVSLVVLMREEGGELTQMPRADAPAPARPAQPPAESALTLPKVELLPATPASKNIGLKPPATAKTPPLTEGTDTRAVRREAEGGAPVPFQEKSETAARAPAEAAAANEGKLRARSDTASVNIPSAPAVAPAASRGRAVADTAAPVTEPALARQEQAAADRLERGSVRPLARQDAPAAAPALGAGVRPSQSAEKSTGETADVVAQMARLTPEKWLERIDELRKQGRIGEARAGLAEFRRRYPDFRLPPALRDLAP